LKWYDAQSVQSFAMVIIIIISFIYYYTSEKAPNPLATAIANSDSRYSLHCAYENLTID